MTIVNIVCVQLDIVWEDKAANFARVEALLAKSGVRKGSLVVLPEMFATGFSLDVAKIAEGPKGETESFLSRLAARHGVYVVGGLVTADASVSGKGRNESLVVGPDGRVLARYHKLQPFVLGGEARNILAGKEIVTFPCNGFTVAPFICYDLRFPEVFRPAARRGAQLFTVIASWPQVRETHWVALLKARAIENQAYVAGVNRCGTDPNHEYSGRSLIVGPGGEVLADAGNEQGVISAEADLEALLKYRRDLPFLADMREDMIRET